MIKKTAYADEQIASALKQPETSTPVAAVSLRTGIGSRRSNAGRGFTVVRE